MDTEEPNDNNDGLGCFNFQLLLDDINSSSQKKRNMFLSPQQETFRRNSISYNQKYGGNDQFISRNLGGDFNRVLRGIGDFEEMNMDSLVGRAAKKPKNRTPDTNYTTNSTTTAKKRNPGRDFNIWGGFKLNKEETVSKSSAQKNDLMKDLGRSFAAPEFENDYKFGSNNDVPMGSSPGNNFIRTKLSSFHEMNTFNHRKSSQQIVNSGIKFNDIFSVSSADTPGEQSLDFLGLSHPHKPVKKTLFAYSESFKPFPVLNKPVKKNSFSAHKNPGLNHMNNRYRKGSLNEREYRSNRHRGYSYQQSDFLHRNNENTIKLAEYVTKDTQIAVDKLKALMEETLRLKRIQEFPLISKNYQTVLDNQSLLLYDQLTNPHFPELSKVIGICVSPFPQIANQF